MIIQHKFSFFLILLVFESADSCDYLVTIFLGKVGFQDLQRLLLVTSDLIKNHFKGRYSRSRQLCEGLGHHGVHLVHTLHCTSVKVAVLIVGQVRRS